jgi:hypothetical protein
MRFFTPELIVAYGADASATWKEAEARWDTACEQYNVYLMSLEPELPAGLRHLEDHYRLHDAVIQGMGRRERTFVIVLQLDTPPQSLLTIAYDLLEEPLIQQEVLPPEYRSTGGVVDWQYDEVEKVPGERPTWRQSILLSNGWEVTLHFGDVKIEEIQALLPTPRDGAGSVFMAGLPQSA